VKNTHLQKLLVPIGYKQAESITFTVTENKETQLVEMFDSPILTDIKLIKINSETKETIKSGFKFGLYADVECIDLITELDSNSKEGTILFEDLRYRYILYQGIISSKTDMNFQVKL